MSYSSITEPGISLAAFKKFCTINMGLARLSAQLEVSGRKILDLLVRIKTYPFLRASPVLSLEGWGDGHYSAPHPNQKG
jgi:hypothetical protein